jgi:Protein of unknown function (DUF3987)
VADGSGADGLLQRFQCTVWPDVSGEWVNVDRWPDSAARKRAWQVFQGLDRLDQPNLATIGADIERAEIPVLRFTPDAQKLFDAWRGELERRLRSTELAATPAYESHVAKYRSLMPSLALIWQMVDVVAGDSTSGRPSLDVARRAAALVDFFDAHARRVYAIEIGKGDAEARALAEKIQAGVVYDGETVRDLYRPQWSNLRTPDAVERGIERLATLGWTRIEERQSGGRPERVLRLRPSFRSRNAR